MQDKPINAHTTQIECDKEVEQQLANNVALVLYNDDIHTFGYVIDALIRICKHTPEQAEQCTYIVHSKGKCEVAYGNPTEIEPMWLGLCRMNLKARIE